VDTKFERLLNLAALLESNPTPLTAAEIRRRIGSYADSDSAFRRTFERDKADLLDIGIPLRSVPGAGPDGDTTGYTIDRSVADPGLSPAQLAALRAAATRLALRGADLDASGEVRDALRKLGGLLGEPGTATVAEIQLDHVVTRVFEAITAGASVRFTHLGRERHVVPRRLILRGGRWYVATFDLDRAEPRNFRLDRIDGPVELAEPVPDHLDVPVERLRLRAWELGGAAVEPALVLLDAEVAPLAFADGPGIEVVEERADGSLVVRLEVRNASGLWHWLAGFLDRAELLGPPGLRNRWIEHLRELASGEVA
jgi:predicted DNA-binding transcriptional regulator YafY